MPDTRLKFAETLARQAGQLAVDLRQHPDGLAIDTKGPQDFVTAADLAVETLIREAIADAYPDDSVLGEEGGLTGDAAACWIIDPIDGTANYMRDMPDWAVSIGYFDGADLTHGVIFAPDHRALASARTGQPARLNDAQISVSDRVDFDQSMVVLGYSQRVGLSDHLDRIGRLLESGCEYRRQGAATIGLMSVASGRVEAYYEPSLNVWDAAAGLVLVRAAGGVVEHPDLSRFLLAPGMVLAANQNAGPIADICKGTGASSNH
ncbi:inositol monophosphatase family protein [Ruegeria jejuensis]|uniref:inositol monophosphatase family protein n=1 Tax=Ruegeria jejuensis TaxID=3233338 RepID=UPI00355C1312